MSQSIEEKTMKTLGKPLQIIEKNRETHRFELDEEALKSVLLRADVKDKPVCVLAVAGGFRTGKSFQLNYFLRYCANQHDNENWMGDLSDSLQGFDWVKSPNPQTTGILIWSEPFFVKLDCGKEVAVFLMDTQGTFDCKTSPKESTVLFALSLLTTSVLVYNIMDNIGGDDLMHLDTFTQYGLLAREDVHDSAPFQKLLFLVRDWIHPDDFCYGPDGGNEYLNSILEDQKKAQQQTDQPTDIRQNLNKCFSDFSCYLMPRPGDPACIAKHFKGNYGDLSDEFVEHIKILVPLLLAPENIQTKRLAGQTIRAKDLYNNFRAYVDLFNRDDLPDIPTVAEVIAKTHCEAVAREAKELYLKEMNEVVRVVRVMTSDELDAKHEHMRSRALKLYLDKSRDMTEKLYQPFEKSLKEELDAALLHYKEITKHNNERVEAQAKLHRANQEAACRKAMQACKEQYEKEMDYIIQEGNVLSSDELDGEHHRVAKNARESFLDNCKQMGWTEDIYSTIMQELKSELEEAIVGFKKKNLKNEQLRQERIENVLMKAKVDAKELYYNGMKETVLKDLLPSDDLRREHSRLSQEALELIQARCKEHGMTEPGSLKQDLEQDLKKAFACFEEQNEKLQKARAERVIREAKEDAKERYCEEMKKTVRERLLSPNNLQSEHSRLSQGALELIQTRCKEHGVLEPGSLKQDLEQEFGKTFVSFQEQNSQKIENMFKEAKKSAKELYNKGMKDIVRGRLLSSDDLQREHSRFSQDALELIQARCREHKMPEPGSLKQDLEQELEKAYDGFEEQNIENKEREQNRVEKVLRVAKEDAETSYDRKIKAIVEKFLLNPDDLRSEHLRLSRDALELIQARCEKHGVTEPGSLKQDLDKVLGLIFTQYEKENADALKHRETMFSEALEKAVELYNRGMKKIVEESTVDCDKLPEEHSRLREEALECIHEQCSIYKITEPDDAEQKLDEVLEQLRHHYKEVYEEHRKGSLLGKVGAGLSAAGVAIGGVGVAGIVAATPLLVVAWPAAVAVGGAVLVAGAGTGIAALVKRAKAKKKDG